MSTNSCATYSSQHFAEAKKILKEKIRKIKNTSMIEGGVLSEAAFPAYAHRNILIEKIFWGRLEVVVNEIVKKKYRRVLDFGAGSGVLSYILAQYDIQVISTDIDLRPMRALMGEIHFPPSVELCTPDELNANEFLASFDAVVALDVLEHVDDIEGTSIQLRKLLKNGGEIIVSGPSESPLYKIGRLLAGREFTGEYHQSNIFTIEEIFAKEWAVSRIASLPFIFPLFIIFTARVR